MLFSSYEAPETLAWIYSSDSSSIVVTKKSWSQTRFRPGWDNFEDIISSPDKKRPRRSRRVIEGYTYRAWIKNNGSKTVTVIGWDYTFKNTEQDEPTHHQFFSRVTIEPGKQKDVSRFVPVPPTRTVDARNAGKEMIEEVIINYIQYEDGTVWRKEGPQQEIPKL